MRSLLVTDVHRTARGRGRNRAIRARGRSSVVLPEVPEQADEVGCPLIGPEQHGVAHRGRGHDPGPGRMDPDSWPEPRREAAPGRCSPAPSPSRSGLFAHLFACCRVAATIHNDEGVSNQEEGGHVYVCTDPVRSWGHCGPRCATTTETRRPATEVPVARRVSRARIRSARNFSIFRYRQRPEWVLTPKGRVIYGSERHPAAVREYYENHTRPGTNLCRIGADRSS